MDVMTTEEIAGLDSSLCGFTNKQLCGTIKTQAARIADLEAERDKWRDTAEDLACSDLVHRGRITELEAALEPNAEPSGPDFLDFIASRLVHVHGESENIDWVRALRRKAKKQRAVLAKSD